MISECCECDRPAIGYWGQAAYCKRHLEDERLTRPLAQRCCHCREVQPDNVSWRGGLCGKCKAIPATPRESNRRGPTAHP